MRTTANPPNRILNTTGTDVTLIPTYLMTGKFQTGGGSHLGFTIKQNQDDNVFSARRNNQIIYQLPIQQNPDPISEP